jgi:hypothetical protein
MAIVSPTAPEPPILQVMPSSHPPAPPGCGAAHCPAGFHIASPCGKDAQLLTRGIQAGHLIEHDESAEPAVR